MTNPRGAIYFIDRAPIDMTYSHTIDFTSPEEQLAFWGSCVKFSVREYNYIRRERAFVQVDKSFETFDGINYLYFQSREDSKYYFAFVTNREYVNDECTRIYFEIDVLQSFMFDYTFKPSYISQGHVDRWDNSHKPIYSRTDEGLNYGTEYVTECAFKIKPDHELNHGFYLVYTSGLTSKNSEFTFDGGTDPPIGGEWATRINGNPTPYILFIIPAFFGEDHNKICGYGGKAISNIQEFLHYMSNTAFGEYVRQIAFVPYLPFPYKIENGDGSLYDIRFEFGGKTYTRALSVTNSDGDRTIHLICIHNITGDYLKYNLASMNLFEGLEEKFPTSAQWEAIKANPYTTERDRRFESKLLTFPYRYNIFTDWVTTPALIKNEFISGDKISVKGAIGYGFNTPRRFWIENYRKDPEGREASVSQLIPFEQPIINDAYYSYLLQNRNQISANITNATINAVANVGAGIAGGAMAGASMGGVAGAVGGAIVGGVKSGIDAGLNIQAMIRSENAKQSDIRNIPDTISNSNDCTLAISDDTRYLTFYRKAICCEFEEQLAQYWHMYGYKVNRMEVPNLRSRVRYNFIKTVGANIEGNIESSYIAILKAIFDRGVTLWHYSATGFNPLDYSYENIERKLL